MKSSEGGSGRRVLVIAYFFPPLGGVSVARLVSLLRNLPGTGWSSTVLAPRGTSYPLRDPGGLARLPSGLTVLRAPSPEPSGIRGAALRVLRGASRPSGDSSGATAARSVAELPPGSLPHALRRLAFFPDDQLAWIPFAVARALRRARRERWDVVYSTSFPISAHVIGGILHHMTGRPWVAEFRDPWVGNVLMPRMPWLHRQLQRKIERWVVRSAARTILVTPGLAAAYAGRYPEVAERFRVVPNGYDRDELAGIVPFPAPDARFRLVYAGTLDRPREMAAFLAGLDLLVQRRPDVRRLLAVDFVGSCAPEVAALAAPYREPGRLADVIDFHGFMSRTAALARVQGADASLIMLGGGPGMSLFVSGKLFDAIGLDRPILAMVPEGDVRTFLAELDWGVVADPEPAAVAAGLECLLRRTGRSGPADPERRFDRGRIAGAFADVLSEAAAERGLAP